MRLLTRRNVLLLGMLVLIGLATGTPATGNAGAPRHQTAIVSFDRSTWVATSMLIGTYVVVHDDIDMVLGKPCTRFYRVGTRTHPLEEVVSFHCIPRERNIVYSFTTTVESDPGLGVDTLTEYQFAGDSEGHGVPLIARVSAPIGTRAPTVCMR